MHADTAEILYSGTLKHHGASQLRDGNGISLTLPERPGQSLGSLLLPMHQNDIPLGSPGPVKILQQFSMVRMAGKGI